MKLMVVTTLVMVTLSGVIYLIVPGIWIPITIPFTSTMTMKLSPVKGFLLGFCSMYLLCMLYTVVAGTSHYLMLPFIEIDSTAIIGKSLYLSMNILVVGFIGAVSGLCGTMLNKYLYKKSSQK